MRKCSAVVLFVFCVLFLSPASAVSFYPAILPIDEETITLTPYRNGPSCYNGPEQNDVAAAFAKYLDLAAYIVRPGRPSCMVFANDIDADSIPSFLSSGNASSYCSDFDASMYALGVDSSSTFLDTINGTDYAINVSILADTAYRSYTSYFYDSSGLLHNLAFCFYGYPCEGTIGDINNQYIDTYIQSITYQIEMQTFMNVNYAV